MPADINLALKFTLHAWRSAFEKLLLSCPPLRGSVRWTPCTHDLARLVNSGQYLDGGGMRPKNASGTIGRFPDPADQSAVLTAPLERDLACAEGTGLRLPGLAIKVLIPLRESTNSLQVQRAAPCSSPPSPDWAVQKMTSLDIRSDTGTCVLKCADYLYSVPATKMYG